MAGNPCKPESETGGGDSIAPAAMGAMGEESRVCCCCRQSLGSGLTVSGAAAVLHSAAGSHVTVKERPCLILVELVDDFEVRQTGGVDDDVPSASAQHVVYRRGTNEYGTVSDPKAIRIYDTLARHDGSNEPIGAPSLSPGDRTWAYFNAQSGRYEVLRHPPEAWRFELTASLSSGGSASAETVEWNGSTWATTGTTLTVYDSLGMFAGASGSRGVAVWHADSARWEILTLDTCCCGEEGETITVLTGVSRDGADLVFTRKELVLPACVEVNAASDVVMEG